MKQHPDHKPWMFNAKADGELEILLYEMIGADFWTGEGITAKSFAEDLKAAGKVSKIHLRVNSPGGNVFDGIAIYNTLLSHGAKVSGQVDGIAASIASVIIMAASEISMGDNTMMMIHNPATMIAGDSHRMRKMADTMDKIKNSIITAYQRHTDLSSDAIATLMDDETWMEAQETVDKGFAENVVTAEGNAAAVATNFDLSHFRRVPQRIAAIAARYAPTGGRDRRRTLHLHTLDLHALDLAAKRRDTLATHTLQLNNMRAADASISPNEQRRRILVEHDREVRAMRAAGFVEEQYYEGGLRKTRLVEAVDGSDARRRVLMQHEKELGRLRMPTRFVDVQT